MVHLPDNVTTEVGQAIPRIAKASTTGPIGDVVGGQHCPDAELVVRVDHGDFAVKRVGSLEVKRDSEPSRVLSGDYILTSSDEHNPLGLLENLRPETHEGLQRVFPRN